MAIQKRYTDGTNHLECYMHDSKLSISIGQNENEYTFFSVDLDANDLIHLINDLSIAIDVIVKKEKEV